MVLKAVYQVLKVILGGGSANTDASHYRDNKNSESEEDNSDHLEIDWLILKEEVNNGLSHPKL